MTRANDEDNTQTVPAADVDTRTDGETATPKESATQRSNETDVAESGSEVAELGGAKEEPAPEVADGGTIAPTPEQALEAESEQSDQVTPNVDVKTVAEEQAPGGSCSEGNTAAQSIKPGGQAEPDNVNERAGDVASTEAVASDATAHVEEESAGERSVPAESEACSAVSAGGEGIESERTHLEFAERVKMSRARGSFRALLGPVPTIAGEDPGDFAAVLEALSRDYAESGIARVRHLWLIETVACRMLTVRRGTLAERNVWDAGIAESLQRRLLDLAAAEELAQRDKDGGPPLTQRDEGIEETLRQSWWRQQKQLARAAVSGDKAAIENIEKRLGPGTVKINAAVDFDKVYDSLTAIDRVVTSARAECENAFRALEKLQKRAKKHQIRAQKVLPHQKFESHEPASAAATDATTDAGVVKYPPPEDTTTENVPTVIAPKPNADADGGAG